MSQVLPTDTLAGIALRYGVSVVDVKRANGLLSDTGMFSRRALAIPPPGGLETPPALATLAGMIVSGYGRAGAVSGAAGTRGGGGPGGSGPCPDVVAATCAAAPRRGAGAAGGRLGRGGAEVELAALAGGLAGSGGAAGSAVAAGGAVRLLGGPAAPASDSLRRRRGGPASPRKRAD